MYSLILLKEFLRCIQLGLKTLYKNNTLVLSYKKIHLFYIRLVFLVDASSGLIH